MCYDVDRPNHTIRRDEPSGIVRVTRRGLLTPEAFDDYERDLRAAVAGARQGRERALVLVDLRSQDVQTREIAERFQSLIADPTLQPARVALVATKALPRMQAERVGNMNQRIFADEDAAISWLTGE